MRRFCSLALLALAGLLGGCDDTSKGEDAGGSILAVNGGPADGQALYSENCAACHEGQVAKAPHRSLLEQMTANALLASLESGLMRSQTETLGSLEKRAIAEHVTGQQAGQDDGQLATAMCKEGDSPFDADAPPKVDGWGMSLDNRRYVPRTVGGISGDDIPKLQLKWTFAYPNAIKARSQPVIAWGALFVGSHDGTVFSLDRKTGCVRWTFTAAAEVRTGIVAEKSATDGAPKLFFGDVIGNVYAIDAATGDLVWRDRPDDHPSLTITAAPTLHEGRLYVALSSLEVTAAANPDYACCTFRGGVAVYDAANGDKIWTSHTIAEAQKEVGANSHGTPIIAPSGSPVWAGITIDRKRRRLYLGTGENYSSPADGTSDAIIAMDMNTGQIAWIMQGTTGDAWNMGCEAEDRANCPPEDGPDYDFGAAPILVTTSSGKDVILAGQKSGEVFGLDPDDGGKIIWRQKLGRGGIQGGVHFGMAADGDVLYVPMSDFLGGPRWPGEPKPGMFALNTADGELLWFAPAPNPCEGRRYCDPGISAAATAIPGAVVAGSMDGYVRAYDKQSGAVLWEFNTAREFNTVSGTTAKGGSIGGGVGPVFEDGMMYISSGYGVYFHMPGNLLLAFGIED